MRALLVGIALSLASTAAWAQEAMSVKTVVLMKDATAFIRTNVDSDVDGPVISGSGFLIRVEGTTGYIVTNAHVLVTPRGEKTFTTQPTTKVYFRSGTKSETKALAEVVANVPERDLALLKVSNVADLPQPIELGSEAEPFETMTVYIFGFPFGQKLALGKGNPPVNVGRGQVSSIRRNDKDQITSVLLDGALNPGNSGGPVVDTKGKLVGVARATIRGANIGFAIAVPELLAVLDGKAEGVTLALQRLNAGIAEVAVEVPLLDPLSRVKSVQLLYTQDTPKFSKSKRAKPQEQPEELEDEDGPLAQAKRDSDAEFVFGPIEGAATIPLRVEKQRATGNLKVTARSKDVVFWCQAALVDGSGAARHAQPGRYFFSAIGANEPERLTFWGEVVDPDNDCDLKLQSGELVYNVPGTLHD